MTTEQFLLSAWSANTWVIASCVALATTFLGLSRAKVSSKSIWLLAGTGTLFITLASPIDALADGYLFSAHMAQHLLLLLIVPAMLLLSLPPATKNPSTGMNALFNRPALPWILGVGGMWLWHMPTLCNAAVTNEWVHRIQYVSLLGMGTAFWWPIIGPVKSQRITPLSGMVYLFTACLGCTVLGIVITFAPVEVCSIYLHPVDRLGILSLIQNQWGLTPAKDQQLGGLLMWVPACLIYVAGIFGLLVRWYNEGSIIAQPQLAATRLEKAHGR